MGRLQERAHGAVRRSMRGEIRLHPPAAGRICRRQLQARARAPVKKASFAKEIEPVQVKAGKETISVTEDENPKKFNEEKLRKLRPAFGEKGTVTAGNASSINDGAAAVVVMSGEKVNALGLKPQARILGYATFAREPEWFTLAPIGAIDKLLKLLALKASDVDLFEINEAFSVVPMAAMKELGIPHDKVNVHGGAVALGHPIGASGARTLVTLINALKAAGRPNRGGLAVHRRRRGRGHGGGTVLAPQPARQAARTDGPRGRKQRNSIYARRQLRKNCGPDGSLSEDLDGIGLQDDAGRFYDGAQLPPSRS